MRPIDTIRQKIDSDLTKYHGSNLCRIANDSDIKSIAGVGLCAMVIPLNMHNENDYDFASTSPDMVKKEENSFPVAIVNRTGRWVERNISSKYLVLILSPVAEKKSMAVGLLVPMSILRDIDVFKNVGSKDSKDKLNYPLQAITKEFIVEDK